MHLTLLGAQDTPLLPSPFLAPWVVLQRIMGQESRAEGREREASSFLLQINHRLAQALMIALARGTRQLNMENEAKGFIASAP